MSAATNGPLILPPESNNVILRSYPKTDGHVCVWRVVLGHTMAIAPGLARQRRSRQAKHP